MGLASFSAASSWVGLNRIDLFLYLIWWLGKGLGLLVDAGKDDGDIRRDVVVFGEARKAIFLDQSLGLHLQFWIRSVWIRAMIELRRPWIGDPFTLPEPCAARWRTRAIWQPSTFSRGVSTTSRKQVSIGYAIWRWR